MALWKIKDDAESVPAFGDRAAEQIGGIASPADVIFVDKTEAALPANRAKGIKNPGWWLYKTWENADGSTQYHAECLVAVSGSNPDALAANAGDNDDLPAA